MVTEVKKYFNYVRHQYFFKKKLNFLILYVTSGCNFKCGTCFFHENLNKGHDLTFEEFKKISENLDEFSILLIGGGEPFLREDLGAICSLFVEKNKIDTLYIPTNGFFTDKILAASETLLKKFPEITLSVNPSLDGLSDYHDKLRGVEGSFNRTIETIKKLSLLKEKYKNLQIIVNSVIHQNNIADLKKLAIYLREFNLDYHAFEVLRGDPRDKNLSSAGQQEIKDIHKFILENRDWYLDRKTNPSALMNFINKLAVMGQLAYTQHLKERVLAGKKWPMKCMAGRSIAVIYPNGDIGLCELLGTIGNIRDYDYNLKKALQGEAAKKILEDIKKSRCSCTHICFINSSIASDWKIFLKLPHFYLKNKK